MEGRRRAPGLVDDAYRAIGEAIVDGRLQPGDRLRDVEVAQLMGISRTPVREALQRLERIGLVEVAANRYTRVTALSDRSRTDMREYAAHTIAGAIRVAVPRCSDDEIAISVGLVGHMRDAATSRTYVPAVLAFVRPHGVRIAQSSLPEGDGADRPGAATQSRGVGEHFR